MDIRDLVKKVIVPVVCMSFFMYIFKPIYYVNGEVDIFKLWILVGAPFGVKQMFYILVPYHYGISGMIGVLVFDFLVGALFGGFVAMYKLIAIPYYLIKFILCKIIPLFNR